MQASPSTLLAPIKSVHVQTSRLAAQHFLTAGDPGSEALVLVHGNVSSSRFYEEVIVALASNYYVIAPDLRGYGESQTLPVDATRGLQDFAEDLLALVATLVPGRQLHLVGWSLGGNVAIETALMRPELLASLTLLNPGSPFGFGGSKGLDGTPCFPDSAGTGGGAANPDFLARLKAGDRSDESPNSPRNILRNFYFRPPFVPAKDREDVFVEAMLRTHQGPQNYPGDASPSENWPGFAPGKSGTNNALSPRYCNQGRLRDIEPKPPILWIRGADDQIVADTSMFDIGALGQLGAIPGWPGADVYPAQPMVSQLRAVLDGYRHNGGIAHEQVFADCGHSPHIEHPQRFLEVLQGFIANHRAKSL